MSPDLSILHTRAYLRHRKIAWSKSGCIAYVTRDAKSVRVVSYPLGPDSSAITLDTSYFHRNEGDFVHLYWDTPGTSLAVVDSLGRISVHRSCLSLSQFNATGHYLPNKIDTCNAVVGMQWISSRAPEVIRTSRTPSQSLIGIG